MKTSQIVNMSIGLTAVPASQTNFSVPALLVDHADVPIDRRYRTVTKSSYATDLTAATPQANWCAALWGQNYNPASAYICRWASAATASYCFFPNASSTYTVYTALTNTGQFGLKEGASAAVEINPDFTGDTSMTDVAASIQTAITAAGGITGSYTCALDALDRIVITSDNTGSSADAVTVQTPLAGVDLTGASYLGTEVSEAGHDIETLGAALAAVTARDDTPYAWDVIGGSIAQRVAFSTSVNALSKYCFMTCYDDDAIDSTATTDFPYQIEALSHQRTHMIFTQNHTDNGASAIQYPSAAIIGEVLPQAEGSVHLANTGLSSVSQSGYNLDRGVIALTDDERSALEDKGCDYLIAPSTVTHLRNGLAAGGNEVRIMIFKDYMEAKCIEDTYAYLVAQNVVTYSDRDLMAIKGIIQKYIDIGIDRGVLDGSTLVWNMPAASDFTAAQKATHTMTLSNVFSIDVLSAVNDITITASFSV